MAITFNKKYPAALTNAAWQRKKSFKDKAKSKTKTGLGTTLTAAEKAWGKIQFDKLIAAKQSMSGKNMTQLIEIRKAAQTYKDGPVVTTAINALDAAASKARVTAANTALSETARKAATALTGALTNQAKLLRDIKLGDFEEKIAPLNKNVNNLEKEHTALLRRMDDLRDDMREVRDLEGWQRLEVLEVLDAGMKISGSLAEVSGDKGWQDNNNHWRRLVGACAKLDQRLKTSTYRLEDDVKEFSDLVQNELGGMFF
jgi:hypothetical protein